MSTSMKYYRNNLGYNVNVKIAYVVNVSINVNINTSINTSIYRIRNHVVPKPTIMW